MTLRYKFGKEKTWRTWTIGDPLLTEVIEGKLTIETDDPALICAITHWLTQGVTNLPPVENKFPTRFKLEGKNILIDTELGEDWLINGPITAITIIRQATGLGLAEAKKIWDDLKSTAQSNLRLV